MTKNIIEMDTYILAEWLHNAYEELSKEKGWKTQKKTQVKFDDLPKKNKEVIFDLASIILTNLAVSDVFNKNNITKDLIKQRLDELPQLHKKESVDKIIELICWLREVL